MSFGQDVLDLEFPGPNPASFVPVYFSFAYRTIGEADRRFGWLS
jgi:hypothetical protein